MLLEALHKLLVRIPIPVLRLLAVLCIWISFTYFFVSLIALGLGTWILLSGSTLFTQRGISPSGFMLQHATQFALGLVGCVMGYAIGRAGGWGRRSPLSTNGQLWAERWRAVIRPSADDHLSDWIVHFDLTPKEVKARLDALPKIPWFPFQGFLTGNHRPSVALREDHVHLMVDPSDLSWCIWRGRIAQGDNGGAELRGRYFHRFEFIELVFGKVVLLIWTLGVGSVGLSLLFSGQALGLAMLAAVVAMNTFFVITERLQRFKVRRYELQLETVFREQLGARSVALKKRYEIFSIDWWKKLAQRR